MSVNVSQRPFQLLVDGVDCSDGLIVFEVGDSKLDEGGWIQCSGSLTLGGYLGFSLDDRENATWARGKVITLNVADSTNTLRRHPRGHQRILKSEYNPETNRLTLQIGDNLVYRASEVPPGGDESGVLIGEYSDRTTIINKLLTAAGAPTLTGSGVSEYPINYPLPQVEGDFIKQAGAIAAAAGYFLWVNGQGQVRVKKLNLRPSRLVWRVVGKSEAGWGRVTGIETPPDKVICEGTVYKASPVQEETESESFEYGKIGDINPTSPFRDITIAVRRVKRSDRLDRIRSQRIQKEWQWQCLAISMPKYFANDTTLGPSLYTETTFSYEFPAPDRDAGGNMTGKPNPFNQQRLFKAEKETKAPWGSVYFEWFEKHPSDRTLYTNLGLLPVLTFSSLETSFYKYFDLPSNFYGDLFSIESRKQQPPATIVPDDTTTFAFMQGKRLSEIGTQAWSKQPRRGFYGLAESTNRCAILATPTTIKAMNPAATLDQKLALRSVPGATKFQDSNSGDLRAPAPERFPGAPELGTRQATGEALVSRRIGGITVPRSNRTQTYTVDYLGGEGSADTQEPEQQLEAIAQQRAALLVGRAYAQQWASDLSDEWFDYEPMSRIDFWERGKSRAYWSDGVAWSMGRLRRLVGGEGCLIGEINDPAIAPPIPGTIPTPPAFPPDDDPAYVAPILAPQFSVELGLGIGLSCLDLPAHRSPNWFLSWGELSTQEWIDLTATQWAELGPPKTIGLGLGIGLDCGLV